LVPATRRTRSHPAWRCRQPVRRARPVISPAATSPDHVAPRSITRPSG
jgi:hypothetical protein